MFSHTLFRSSLVRFGLIAVMLSLGFFVGTQLTDRVEAASVSSTNQMVANQTEISTMPVGTDAMKSYTCNVGDVQNDLNFAALGCAVPDGAIKYFVTPVTDSQRVNRSLSIWLTALALGKKVLVVYDPDDISNLPAGCNASNCRVTLETVIFN